MHKSLFTIIFFLFTVNFAFSQQDITQLNEAFEKLALQKKGLNEVVKTDVSGLTLHDFITSLAQEHQLNVDVDSNLNQSIVNNFFDVTVKEVLVHLIVKHDIEVEFLNNIIVFKKKKEPLAPFSF